MLAPGQQLLLDVGQLIHNQVPDSDGNVIPPEMMMGSYELRDLDHPAVGLLYEGKLTIDKTYGHASYGCGTCCGLLNPTLIPNPFSGPASIYNQDYYQAKEQWGGYTPQPLPPQNPLSSTKIDHGTQAWFIGSGINGSGIHVQSDSLQKYLDHGRHQSIVSPVR